jgi:hypothetical protein
MGWGISFNTKVYLSRQDYQENVELVQYKIDELNKSIESYKSKLKMYASATVRDIIPTEWIDEPIRWVEDQIDTIIECYDEDFALLKNLLAYKEHLIDKNKNSKNEG